MYTFIFRDNILCPVEDKTVNQPTTAYLEHSFRKITVYKISVLQWQEKEDIVVAANIYRRNVDRDYD